MDIDVVIAWVDGNDPAHAAKRAPFISPDKKGEAYALGRWVQSDEVIFCLRSIGKFAPWVRRIFIVTDNQTPNLSKVDKKLRDRIEIVDHKVIFRGHEDCLPTFNSVTIASAIHRIPGLSDRYIYFNDDCFLLADCKPEDFFTPEGLVLRGDFVESFEKKGLYTQHRLNAAHMVGVEPGKIFRAAHVCRPILKPLLEDYFTANPGLFEQNISFRFRDKSQFLMSTLVEHLAIAKGIATIMPNTDCYLIAPDNSPAGNVQAARRQMARLLAPHVKLGCINNFSSLIETDPKVIVRFAKRLKPSRPVIDSPPARSFLSRIRGIARRLLRGRR